MACAAFDAYLEHTPKKQKYLFQAEKKEFCLTRTSPIFTKFFLKYLKKSITLQIFRQIAHTEFFARIGQDEHDPRWARYCHQCLHGTRIAMLHYLKPSDSDLVESQAKLQRVLERKVCKTFYFLRLNYFFLG